MVDQNQVDIFNFDNAIKKILPEFNSLPRMLPGRVSNFMQGEMAELLREDVMPQIGGMSPMNAFIMTTMEEEKKDDDR